MLLTRVSTSKQNPGSWTRNYFWVKSRLDLLTTVDKKVLPSSLIRGPFGKLILEKNIVTLQSWNVINIFFFLVKALFYDCWKLPPFKQIHANEKWAGRDVFAWQKVTATARQEEEGGDFGQRTVHSVLSFNTIFTALFTTMTQRWAIAPTGRKWNHSRKFELSDWTLKSSINMQVSYGSKLIMKRFSLSNKTKIKQMWVRRNWMVALSAK